MNRYRLMHITEFSYDAPVTESYNEVRLRPLQDETQSCLSFRLTTDPDSYSAEHSDYYGNSVHRFNILAEHEHLSIEADSVVLVQERPSLPDESLALVELQNIEPELDLYYDYLTSTDYVPLDDPLRDLASRAEAHADGTCAGFVNAAMQIVHSTFRYEKGATHVNSSISDTLETGVGVCQDFAHILLGVVRTRGIPGRYVSGYLVPRGTTEPGAGMEEVIGGQASHAWMEAFLPGSGWFGLDPTLGQQTGVQHVRVAYGRDYGDAAPVRGIYRGQAGQRLSVDVRVRPALDDEGHEHLQETHGPVFAPDADALAQQYAAQQ